MKQFLEIGKIVSVHGIKGEIKLVLWCDSPDFIKNIKHFYFSKGEQDALVTSVRIQKNMAVMKLEGYDIPEDAVKLRGKILYINRVDVKLPEHSYFIQDLIGMNVVDADNGKLYGVIQDVSATGANDVYHIKSPDDKLYYIPAIKQVVINTDVENNTMTIRPLEGLFDDED